MQLVKYLKAGGGGWNSLDINSKQLYVMNYLLKEGFTPNQASAITGNLMQESRLKHTIEDNIGGYGIAQWLGPRRKRLYETGDPTDINHQLKFLVHEIRGNGWAGLNNLKTAFLNNQGNAEQLAVIFQKGFERGSEKYARNDKRMEFTKNALSLLQSKNPNISFQSTNYSQPTTQVSYQPSNYIVQNKPDLQDIYKRIENNPENINTLLNSVNKQWYYENQKLQQELLKQEEIEAQNKYVQDELQQEFLNRKNEEQEFIFNFPTAKPVSQVSSFQRGGKLSGVQQNVVDFHDELSRLFPGRVVVTSGRHDHRKQTSNGRISRHALGQAIDLRADAEIRKFLYSAEGDRLMRKYSLGFLDEAIQSNLAKTKGTGPHFHIGMDFKGNSSPLNTFLPRQSYNGTIQPATYNKQPIQQTYQPNVAPFEPPKPVFGYMDKPLFTPTPSLDLTLQQYIEGEQKNLNEELLAKKEEQQNFQNAVNYFQQQDMQERQNILQNLPTVKPIPRLT